MANNEKTVAPVPPDGMEILFFYQCPSCGKHVAVPSPTEPRMLAWPEDARPRIRIFCKIIGLAAKALLPARLNSCLPASFAAPFATIFQSNFPK